MSLTTVPQSMLTLPLTAGTAQASTSGTSIDFTGIPAGVKRVTLMFAGVSTNGTSFNLVQLGAGSVTTAGYVSNHGVIVGGAVSATGVTTTGFGVWNGNAAEVRTLHMVLTNVSGNTWVASHSGGMFNGTNYYAINGGGYIALSGTLDRVRITTVNGTDTFDAGSVNILWE